MLTMRTNRNNGSTTIEEIEHASINYDTSCIGYMPKGGKTLMQLRPEEVNQAFIMNDAGKTVLAHTLREPDIAKKE